MVDVIYHKYMLHNKYTMKKLYLLIVLNLTNRAGFKEDVSKAPSTRIRIFSNPQLFLSGYGYRPRVSSEFDSESGKK